MPLVVSTKQRFQPIDDDMESSAEKRQKILGNLSAHIPHALSVQYWKKEKELQTTVTQEDDRNSSNTENNSLT